MLARVPGLVNAILLLASYDIVINIISISGIKRLELLHNSKPSRNLIPRYHPILKGKGTLSLK